MGEVRDRSCLIVDDMISTGSTVVKSIEALRAAGSGGQVLVAATHGVFSADALARLESTGAGEMWVTDTVATAPHAGVRAVSVAPLLAEAVRRLAYPAAAVRAE